MLISLDIRNFVLIDKLRIRFDGGFNVLTGETGAGKSIIISALELITGEKGSTRYVGHNGEKLLVIGSFDLSKAHSVIREYLTSHSIDISSGEIVIRREITRDGKSRSFINTTSVRVSDLKELGDMLVDIHGQHEHQALFNPINHLEYYDSYAKIYSLREKYKEEFDALSKLEKQYKEITDNKNARMKEKSFLSYAVEEIENAKLSENEEDEVKNKIYMMSNSEKVSASLSSVMRDIYGSENGGCVKLSRAMSALAELSSYDTRLEDISNQIDAITLNLEDIKPVISSILQKTKFNPVKLQELNERLFLINTLKKKYGSSIKDILAYKDEAKEKLIALNFSEDDIVKLTKDIDEKRRLASGLAKELSDMRMKARQSFVNAIEKEMTDLGMDNTRFDIELTKDQDENGIIEIDGVRYKATAFGIDNAEFIIAPNKSAMFFPLRKIASGGEISRIMLSLKTVLADGDHSSTMVFDEIDTGVGGRIAEVIGQKIASLSKKKQILAVTHLAQIAIYGGKHFKVKKEGGEESVTSTIEEISKDARISEIARMIAGKEITRASIEHAKEMLDTAFALNR